MAKFQLSKSAEIDLLAIADFTIEKFGIQQSRTYKDQLIKCFGTLSHNPDIGRSYLTKSGHQYQRYRFKAHSIFYLKRNSGIRIIRILGAKMDFDNHLL